MHITIRMIGGVNYMKCYENKEAKLPSNARFEVKHHATNNTTRLKSYLEAFLSVSSIFAVIVFLMHKVNHKRQNNNNQNFHYILALSVASLGEGGLCPGVTILW